MDKALPGVWVRSLPGVWASDTPVVWILTSQASPALSPRPQRMCGAAPPHPPCRTQKAEAEEVLQQLAAAQATPKGSKKSTAGASMPKAYHPKVCL